MADQADQQEPTTPPGNSDLPADEFTPDAVESPTTAAAVIFAEPEETGLGTSRAISDALHIQEEDSDERIIGKLRSQGVRLAKGMITPTVFWPSVIVVLGISILAMVFPEQVNNVLQSIQNWIVDTLGWYYVLCVVVFIVVSLFFCLSKYGKIKLGHDDEEPEYGVFSWFTMLFAAGMGIGLVFYGVGEPLTYATVDPKPGWDGNETDIAKLAMAQTFIHWGLHPWAIYAVIGLSVAYAIHRRGRPVSIRWAFEPLLGDRVKGWMGDIIDILAVFGTIFGVATSLGLGVQQIGSGLEAIGIVETADTVLLIILISVITLIATFSVVSGVGRGMKWLSNFNLSMAGVVMIAVLLFGPTLFIFENLIESIGVYLANIFNMSFDVAAYTGAEGSAWASTWTLFYWGWWISWAPFVGIFIARISRGRTVREFVTGVLLVPTLVGMIWFGVMGGAGIYRQLFGAGDLVTQVNGEDTVVAEAVLFDVLGDMPWGAFWSVIGILLVAIFFITSSDSGSLVVDMLASGGHPNPPTWSRVLFALASGALAIGLLLAGGLEALQAGALATALPFSVVLLLMCVATARALKYDHSMMEHQKLQERYAAFAGRFEDEHDMESTSDAALDERIDTRIDYRLSATRGVFSRPQREPRPSRLQSRLEAKGRRHSGGTDSEKKN